MRDEQEEAAKLSATLQEQSSTSPQHQSSRSRRATRRPTPQSPTPKPSQSPRTVPVDVHSLALQALAQPSLLRPHRLLNKPIQLLGTHILQPIPLTSSLPLSALLLISAIPLSLISPPATFHPSAAPRISITVSGRRAGLRNVRRGVRRGIVERRGMEGRRGREGRGREER